MMKGERCANGIRFGLGGLVHAAGSGFRWARPWGKERMKDEG